MSCQLDSDSCAPFEANSRSKSSGSPHACTTTRSMWSHHQSDSDSFPNPNDSFFCCQFDPSDDSAFDRGFLISVSPLFNRQDGFHGGLH